MEEGTFLNAVVMIATGAAVIKFAMYEWQSILEAWSRVTGPKRRRNFLKTRPR
jgi:hypothetical protein